MNILKKNNLTIEETRKLENMASTIEKQKAITDYIAMMTEVEIPVEEDEVLDNE